MIRTLIVDDEILSRIGLQSFIDGKEGIVVSGVFGGAAEAIDFLRENVVDVVLTDIEMTDINGLEFIQYIRENKLAGGVIIVSCHDDFSYAQRAISLGTDGYILKHSVTEEMLIDQIKRAYEKTANGSLERSLSEPSYRKQKEIRQGSIYRVGVLMLNFREILEVYSEQQLEGDMLVHLLEGIVERYQMGTLFAPYNREIFILFQFEKDQPTENREELLNKWIAALEKNTRQYINGNLICGLSGEFESLTETRSCYEKAALAAEQSFYQQEKTLFWYKNMTEPYSLRAFSATNFLEEKWLETEFDRELEEGLRQAGRVQAPVADMKEKLIWNLNQMLYQILGAYCFSEEFRKKWNSDVMFISVITSSRNSRELKNALLERMEQFHKEARTESAQNELSEILLYINQHLEEKITLTELCDIGCMSIPSFSKKFKEQMGMTLVQYLNEKRIDRAKVLLRQQRYTLWQIAEMTGFSNTNYLLRVFKKITGQTISEYRRQFGILE